MTRFSGRLFLLFLATRLLAIAQSALSYSLRVDPTDLSHVEINLELRNAPHIFHLAAATHFLNQRNYASNIEDLKITEGTLEHVEEPLWKATISSSVALIHYRVRIEQNPGVASATQPFLSPTGALLGDVNMFLYVVEAPSAPIHVNLALPADWKIATSLAPTSDAHVFYAGSAEELLDAPILAGNLREWRFSVEGAPIRIAYWPLPNATPFDEKTLTSSIEQIVRQSVAIFGSAPWREYVFQIRDGARGALEHRDSLTVGAQSANLAKNPHDEDEEVAHEFFHTWNMMRIRSAEYRGLDYHPVRYSGLWFSEGATMFYADLIMRRARLPVEEPTRIAHLEQLIASNSYLRGHSIFSAEQISLGSFDLERPLGGVGDYAGSTHTQGELLVAMLDLIIRDATKGERSMDDFMRAMNRRFGDERGFTSNDAQRVADDVCGCDLSKFFGAYIRGAAHMDINRYLKLAGLQGDIERGKQSPEGKALDDRVDVLPWMAPGETNPRIQLVVPDNGWGRAGLHTGDQIMKLNDSTVTNVDAFRSLLEPLHIGDSFRIEFSHQGRVRDASVTIGPREYPVVKIHELQDATLGQREIFRRWSTADR